MTDQVWLELLQNTGGWTMCIILSYVIVRALHRGDIRLGREYATMEKTLEIATTELKESREKTALAVEEQRLASQRKEEALNQTIERQREQLVLVIDKLATHPSAVTTGGEK